MIHKAKNGEDLLDIYARTPVSIVRGEGSYLIDNLGKSYLDFGSGIAANSLGHGHPILRQALLDQVDILWHCSNKFHIPEQIKCAEKLVELTFADKVFFCNSGAEANEAGLKIMRRFQSDSSHPERYRTIVFNGAFHGRTFASLAATNREDYREGFGPILSGFDRAKFNDIEDVANMIGPKTAGVLIEPIQGDGGVNVADRKFLHDLRALTYEAGILLMVDEIQTGVGRTDAFLACEKADIVPDIVSLAKGLGGGFPIGAVIDNS